jgi:hypothetical protein
LPPLLPAVLPAAGWCPVPGCALIACTPMKRHLQRRC